MAGEKQNLTIFTNNTADRILNNLPTAAPMAGRTGQKPSDFKSSKIEFVTFKVKSETGDGLYVADQVVLDDSDEDPANHEYVSPDQALKDITIRETSGKTGVPVDTVVVCKENMGQDERKTIWEFTQGGGGDVSVYVEIVGPNTTNSYTVQQFDNPVDRNIVGDPFVALAIQHDFGTLPNTLAGKGFWISQKSDGNYYLEPSIFYGF